MPPLRAHKLLVLVDSVCPLVTIRSVVLVGPNMAPDRRAVVDLWFHSGGGRGEDHAGAEYTGRGGRGGGGGGRR